MMRSCAVDVVIQSAIELDPAEAQRLLKEQADKRA